VCCIDRLNPQSTADMLSGGNIGMATRRGFVGYITRISLPVEAWLKAASLL
jgi:hypothetical protein